MSYTKQDLQNLHSLSYEDVNATFAACGLSTEQNEYTDEQIESGFNVIRKYFNDAQVTDYSAAAQMFNQQQSAAGEPKTKKKSRSNKSNNSTELDANATTGESNNFDISQLLALATQECETRISLTEAGKILAACNLPDKEAYTSVECDHFIEACTLIKQQGKTYEEVAEQFGVVSQGKSNAHNILLDEVRQLLSQPAFSQAEQIREALPQMAVEQLEEIKALFWQMTAQRLRQYVDSGQLEAEIRQASKSVLATSSGNYLGLLGSSSSPNQKRLPG